MEAAAEKSGYTGFSGVTQPQNPKDNYSLRYGTFVVPVVKAVQKLHEEDELLKEKLEAMIKVENSSGRSL